ncbi:MAG: ABC transporter ATP-binding protein [Peptostreptococcaceae bacterium]
MLRGNNITFSYSKDKPFIKDLNIDIPKGKITTILGPNGSGKSTLLSILSCYNRPQSGEVYINNTNLNKLKYRQIAKKIATVHQHNSSPDDITVETLVSYGRTPHTQVYKNTKEEDCSIIDWALNSTGMHKLAQKKVMSLSGGQRQRAFIAMALAQKTDILLLDEPTTYLDIYHQIEILEMVRELNEKHNITIVMVLHDINQAIKYSHNIVIMKNGQIINQGQPEEVINKNIIEDVYKVQGFIGKSEEDNEMYFIPLKVC